MGGGGGEGSGGGGDRAAVVGRAVPVAAVSPSGTWGAGGMSVDVPSSKAATARQTTKLGIAVARTHEAAATPAMRRRDLFTT